jgi:hypothetical protein
MEKLIVYMAVAVIYLGSARICLTDGFTVGFAFFPVINSVAAVAQLGIKAGRYYYEKN